jgi:hypothetical protein
MPSTYSSNLRLELMATGEQQNTWGNTTNVNLGTILDDAVAGYKLISVNTTNYPLSAVAGAVDDARNMTLDLIVTGAVTSAFNVYAPPAEKFYVVRNSSIYQATLFCATSANGIVPAGRGVIVPAGATTILFADSINMDPAINYLANPNFAPITTVASAATTDLANTSSNQISISGAATISSFGNTALGAIRFVSFTGAATIVHSVPNIILPGAANIVTAAGDCAIFRSEGVGSWRCLEYQQSSVAPGAAPTQAVKNSSSLIANTAFVDRLRSLLPSSISGAATLTLADRGCVVLANSAITVPPNVFAAGDVVTICNINAVGGANITITRSSGMLMYISTTGNEGIRALAPKGVASVVFTSPTEAIISGGGLS